MQFYTRDEKHADLIHDIEKSVDGGQTFPQMQSVSEPFIWESYEKIRHLPEQ